MDSWSVRDELYDIWDHGQDSIYYNQYNKVLSYGLWNAKCLAFLTNACEDDGEPTLRNPSCPFCREEYKTRYYFPHVIFYIGLWSSQDICNYFMCKNAMKDVIQFKNQYMNISYLLSINVVNDVSHMIFNLYLQICQQSSSHCIKLKMMNRRDWIKRQLNDKDQLLKGTIKELTYYMAIHDIKKEQKGTGKNGCYIKKDYIQLITHHFNNLDKELEELNEKIKHFR